MNYVFLLLWLLSAPFIITGIICNARFSDFWEACGRYIIWMHTDVTWESALANLLINIATSSIIFALIWASQQ